MRILFVLAFCVSFLVSFGQTGPAGIGSSSNNGLWLKADAGTSTTSNGVAVSSWTDQSGNSNSASQSTGTQQPVYTTSLINSQPALLFDNQGSPNNDEMVITDAASLDPTTGLTILTVTRPISIDNSSARAIVSKRTSAGVNESYMMFFFTNNNMYIDIDNNNNRFNTNQAFVAGRDYIVSLTYDGTLGTASQRVKVYVNENLDITATETSTTIPNSSAPVTIGSLNTGDGRPFGGYIAEVIIFTKTLLPAERIIIHNYLMAKYGINSSSIPATTNDIYAGDDSGNGNYDYEVCGIGTESTGSNTSASSAPAGGLGLTQSSGFQNGDYIIYGHQSGSNGSQVTDVGGMTGVNNARWSRIWYLDMTNIGANPVVNMSFDMSDAGTPLTPVTASDYVLLRRAGQSGNWTEVATASSIVGDALQFPSVTVSADGYYTLGSKNYLSSPLPVGLLSFTGDHGEKGVELNWATATEWQNDYFTVLRSSNGTDFKPWKKIAGSGNSFTQIQYNVTDAFPFEEKTYYRLLQTDFDGKVTNLGTILIHTGKQSSELQVYPNPSRDHFVITKPGESSGHMIRIFAADGRPVNFEAKESEKEILIDIPGGSGLYLVRLTNTSGTYTAKVVLD